MCRPPLLSQGALPFASSYSAWFPPQCSLLSVNNPWCYSETFKAFVCCLHSLFPRGISTPDIPSYPIYTCRTQNGNTFLRLWSLKLIFWMTVAVVESSSSSPPPLSAASLLHDICVLQVIYLVTFEEVCFPDSMICTSGCNLSFMYSCWWARWKPETCRVI